MRPSPRDRVRTAPPPIFLPRRLLRRTPLDRVFEGDMSDHDWDHALGGVHALMGEGGELIGHASVIQRRRLHGRRASFAVLANWER